MSFIILGFMGESGHGKDFCGHWFERERGFVRVAFADVMKRFVERVFGFPAAALWGDSTVRNQPVLPHAAHCELNRAAWDRAAGAFLRSVADFVNELIPSPHESLVAYEDYVAVLVDWFGDCRDRAGAGLLSPRTVLQLLGTEYGRHIRLDLWVDYLHQQVIPRIREGAVYHSRFGFTGEVSRPPPGVVITDHRFRNEVEATRARGGHVVKVVRLAHRGQPNAAEAAGVGGHASEVEQRDLPDTLYSSRLELQEGAAQAYPQIEALYHALT